MKTILCILSLFFTYSLSAQTWQKENISKQQDSLILINKDTAVVSNKSYFIIKECNLTIPENPSIGDIIKFSGESVYKIKISKNSKLYLGNNFTQKSIHPVQKYSYIEIVFIGKNKNKKIWVTRSSVGIFFMDSIHS